LWTNEEEKGIQRHIRKTKIYRTTEIGKAKGSIEETRDK
jgi:hypothetical protein